MATTVTDSSMAEASFSCLFSFLRKILDMKQSGLQGNYSDANGSPTGNMASLTFSYDVHPAGSLLYYVLCAGTHRRGQCCHHLLSRFIPVCSTLERVYRR